MLNSRCVVISLAEDHERRTAFSDHAQKAQMAWQFFDAHKELQNGLAYDETKAIVRRGRKLISAELGCYSSHYATWCDFLQSDADQLIVLEDDVLVDWEFLARVAQHNFAQNNIHYVRLASKALPPVILKGKLLDRYLVHFLGYALGCQAYLLTRDGARHLKNHCRTAYAPIDDMLDQAWRGALPTYGIYHHPVIERAAKSTIGPTRDVAPTMTPALRFRRFMFRVDEKLRSRGYRLLARLGLVAKVRGIDARWI
jgi:glycosyl transferase, family 25